MKSNGMSNERSVAHLQAPSNRRPATSDMTLIALAPVVLSIPDAARYLGCSTNLIEIEMRESRLSFLTYGGKRVIRVEELQRWLGAQKEMTGLMPNNIRRSQSSRS
jgi:hypothetical protein